VKKHFDQWADFVLGIEKEFSDHPADRGRKTYWGFTEAFLSGVNEEPPKTREDAKELMYRYFWSLYGLDEMNWFIAWCYGDGLFQHNPRSAAKCLQAGSC